MTDPRGNGRKDRVGGTTGDARCPICDDEQVRNEIPKHIMTEHIND